MTVNHRIDNNESIFPCPYLNRNVELTEERQQHIIQTHPKTLPDYWVELAETINNPDPIRQSKLDSSALLFSKWFDTITSKFFSFLNV